MVQDVAANREWAKVLGEHPKYEDREKDNYQVLGENSDGSKDYYGSKIPESVKSEIEHKSREIADQVMGKDYKSYIGDDSGSWESLGSWGLSEGANAPWTLYHENGGTRWAGIIGKCRLVGAGVGGAYSAAQDIKKYSGKDRKWALTIDGISTGIGVLVGAF